MSSNPLSIDEKNKLLDIWEYRFKFIRGFPLNTYVHLDDDLKVQIRPNQKLENDLKVKGDGIPFLPEKCFAEMMNFIEFYKQNESGLIFRGFEGTKGDGGFYAAPIRPCDVHSYYDSWAVHYPDKGKYLLMGAGENKNSKGPLIRSSSHKIKLKGSFNQLQHWCCIIFAFQEFGEIGVVKSIYFETNDEHPREFLVEDEIKRSPLRIYLLQNPIVLSDKEYRMLFVDINRRGFSDLRPVGLTLMDNDRYLKSSEERERPFWG